jgi:hypothetical protein
MVHEHLVTDTQGSPPSRLSMFVTKLFSSPRPATRAARWDEAVHEPSRA